MDWGEIVSCGVEAEIRNRGHSYCGAVKQIKMVWTSLKEERLRLCEKCSLLPDLWLETKVRSGSLCPYETAFSFNYISECFCTFTRATCFSFSFCVARLLLRSFLAWFGSAVAGRRTCDQQVRVRLPAAVELSGAAL